ncbi:unnamed protein product [Protopolystoma xenopodis]|uniref:Uncharacterized protein n=1 Tax=Protopolystoma xenopodis TaxID=117903 RepID=A0A3S5CNG7_9PLAT|nr:unnamed protein product [Protopolystoma xenopodis]
MQDEPSCCFSWPVASSQTPRAPSRHPLERQSGLFNSTDEAASTGPVPVPAHVSEPEGSGALASDRRDDTLQWALEANSRPQGLATEDSVLTKGYEEKLGFEESLVS